MVINLNCPTLTGSEISTAKGLQQQGKERFAPEGTSCLKEEGGWVRGSPEISATCIGKSVP